MKTWHYIISEKCNMACSYCNVNVNESLKLSNQNFDKLYSTFDNNDYYFDIFGGESLLNLKEVNYIVNILKNDKRCLRIKIPTNGTIYNQDVINLLKIDKVKLSISYDGLWQSETRGSQKVYLQELHEAGATNCHMMLIGDMFNNFNKNVLIENHKHIKSFNLIPDMTIVRDIGVWDNQQVVLFLQSYDEYVKYIMKTDINDFLEIPGLIRNYLNALFEYSIKGNKKNDCGCGSSYNSILPSGEIIACERFSRDDTDISLKNQILNDCNTCSIRNFCNRGCIYEQIKNNGVIIELCAIYKGIFKILQSNVDKKMIKLFTQRNYYGTN